jgi:hypothetical protein
MEIKYFYESIFSAGDEVLSFGRSDKVNGSIVKAAKMRLGISMKTHKLTEQLSRRLSFPCQATFQDCLSWCETTRSHRRPKKQ